MSAVPGEASETPMVSQRGYAALRDVRTDQSLELAEAVRLVLSQVERPRVNLGGNGPPGRAD